MGRQEPKVALVGNPNCGKSSIFNALTGLNQKIGNYPGVTVDKKTGHFTLSNGQSVEITDLPGTYSIYPKSQDEEIVYDVLLDPQHPEHPDTLVVVVDASNLKRNLLLCSQVLDLQMPTLVVLSMTDIVEKEGSTLDIALLKEELGVPVIPVNARKLSGLQELKHALENPGTASSQTFCPASKKYQSFIDAAQEVYPKESPYLLMQYAINPKSFHYLPEEKLTFLQALAEQHGLKQSQFQAEETLQRYQRINRILQKALQLNTTLNENLTDKLDRLLTHRFWGYVILVGILFAIFQAIFTLAAYPMDLVEAGTSLLSEWLLNALPAGWGTDLLVNGVIAGVGGVVIFIPQIAILFGFLTIMEETGYMARVSYLTDRLMRSAGLNGKSVIPLMSGLACAIPAVMAARNIGNWKERLITILVTPLMSCSARLPVYTILISLVIPNNYVLGFISLQGLTLLGLYLLGLVTAMAVAFVLSRLIRTAERSLFLLEMPIYRPPRWRNVLLTMYEKAKIFTLEAGKVILVISIILWFLASYGPQDIGWDVGPKAQTEAQDIPGQTTAEAVQLRNSFAGHFGKVIEPAIAPLGFDWKMGIALITSFAAREVFVGTMATIYSVEAGDEDVETVRERMQADTKPGTDQPVYTLATGLSLMVFFAFAMQCMSTLAIVRRETKSWKWPTVQLVYMTGLAYVASLITYQLLA